MYEVGTKLIVTGNDSSGLHHYFETGDVIEVLETCLMDNGEYHYNCDADYQLRQWIDQNDCKLYEEVTN